MLRVELVEEEDDDDDDTLLRTIAPPPIIYDPLPYDESYSFETDVPFHCKQEEE